MRVSRLEIIARDAIAVAAGLPLAAHLACAGAAPEADRAGAAMAALASAAPPDAVRIQLVFGADVDLDLYVTGPADEAVYFANATSRDGGRLVADRRCDSPAPRVETIEFARAAAGRYRVGVDFMMRCERGVDRAPFELIAEAPGRPPVRQRGEAIFGAFDPRVLEFEVRGGLR
jgi:hypothetical protein